MEFQGRYRSVLLGQVREGEGRLRIHEIVGDVPERRHQDELGAGTGGKRGKNGIGGEKNERFEPVQGEKWRFGAKTPRGNEEFLSPPPRALDDRPEAEPEHVREGAQELAALD